MAEHDLEPRQRKHLHGNMGIQEDDREGCFHDEYDPFAGDGDPVDDNSNISLTAPPQSQ